MDTMYIVNKCDAATSALERIRVLAGIIRSNDLETEEIHLLCTLIYENTELPTMPEA